MQVQGMLPYLCSLLIVTSKSLGPSKETYQEATKTQVHLVSKWRKYGTLTSMGKKSHCKIQNKATMKNTTSDQKNHYFS